MTAVADVSFTFLGTGTSVGVPVIGCGCVVCTSEDPRNRRLRSSVVVRAGGKTVLVDSGPDLRMQALREGLKEIDAIVYTHAHLDHVAGFDELRAFCWRRVEPLPLHATEECLGTLKNMYGWAFSEDNHYRGYVRPDARVIDGPFVIGDLRITPLPVEHAALETVGFLFGYPLAMKLGIPFILIRKKGKLPYDKISHAYDLEYGSATIEMHTDAIKANQKVLIHDDLLATGGSADAAAQLIKKCGGEVVGFDFLVGLDFLNGREKLLQHSSNIQSLINY